MNSDASDGLCQESGAKKCRVASSDRQRGVYGMSEVEVFATGAFINANSRCGNLQNVCLCKKGGWSAIEVRSNHGAGG